jgi:hypothetical protein
VVPIALLAGCGGRQQWNGDPKMYGVFISVEDGANPYTAAPDFLPRVRRILAVSSHFYGHDPLELSGVRIIFGTHGTDCGAARNWMGCYTESTNTIFVTTESLWTSAVEETQLPHEMLHYFIGDPRHTASLWRQLGPLWEMLNPDVPYVGQWD